MLNCKDVTEHACDYIEHHLPWHKRLQMKLHLLICHHCRRYIRQMMTTVGIIKQSTHELDDAQAKQIVGKIIEQKNASSK